MPNQAAISVTDVPELSPASSSHHRPGQAPEPAMPVDHDVTDAVDARSKARNFTAEVATPDARNLILRIRHARSRSIVLEWQGETARRLLKTGLAGLTSIDQGTRELDKCDVKRLTLAATGLHLAAGRKPPGHAPALADRLSELGLRLPAGHNRVASLLYAHRGVHFEQHEAASLVILHHPALCPASVLRALDRLVDWRVLQRIEVDDCVFFDVDTSPHLHVFCKRTRQLFDAPTAGVVRAF